MKSLNDLTSLLKKSDSQISNFYISLQIIHRMDPGFTWINYTFFWAPLVLFIGSLALGMFSPLLLATPLTEVVLVYFMKKKTNSHLWWLKPILFRTHLQFDKNTITVRLPLEDIEHNIKAIDKTIILAKVLITCSEKIPSKHWFFNNNHLYLSNKGQLLKLKLLIPELTELFEVKA